MNLGRAKLYALAERETPRASPLQDNDAQNRAQKLILIPDDAEIGAGALVFNYKKSTPAGGKSFARADTREGTRRFL